MYNNDFKPSNYLERSIREGDIFNIRGALLGIIDSGGGSQELEEAVRYVEGQIPQNQLFEANDPELDGSDMESDYYYIRSVLGQNFSREKLNKLETLIRKNSAVIKAQASSACQIESGRKQSGQKMEIHGNYGVDNSRYGNKRSNSGSVKEKRAKCAEKIYQYAHCNSYGNNNWWELHKYLYNEQFDELYEDPIKCPCIENLNNWKGIGRDKMGYYKALSELLRINFSKERIERLREGLASILKIKY